MSAGEVVDDRVHRYRRGLHHQSVDECPDCGEDTYACEVQLTWYDPPDIVVREATGCSCYRPGGILNRLRRLVKGCFGRDTEQEADQ